MLRAVRLAGVADTPAIVRRSLIPVERCETALADAAGLGYVRRRAGRLPGWTLTATGRDEGQRLALRSIAERIESSRLAAGYREFLVHNAAVLEVCTDWQVVTGPSGVATVNRHDDPEYDAAVIERLVERHRAAAPLVGRLGDELEEFAAYPTRLDHAVGRTVAGDHEWFTRPLIDSFHSVWFELHEDLLLATGRERIDERGPHDES